jgi:cytochrome c5
MERETMTMRHIQFAVLILASISTLTLVAQQSSAPANPPAKKTGASKQAAQPQDEGSKIFQQQCSRCHTAPDGFSPRISGTVLRHMRVRASLSQHDEQELLRFFNP